MRILNLILKKKWLDMIASGEKREEYREMKPYWHKRLDKEYEAIRFRNGYTSTSPTVTVKLREVLTGFGFIEWGSPQGQKVYILRLGNILGA